MRALAGVSAVRLAAPARATFSAVDTDVHAVIAHANRRSAALVARDTAALVELMHPRLRWTTHTGRVLRRDEYVEANTHGELRWLAQRMEDVAVEVFCDAAVLTALVIDEVRRGDGVPETFILSLTLGWIRTGGGWTCVSGHAGPRISGSVSPGAP